MITDTPLKDLVSITPIFSCIQRFYISYKAGLAYSKINTTFRLKMKSARGMGNLGFAGPYFLILSEL